MFLKKMRIKKIINESIFGICFYNLLYAKSLKIFDKTIFEMKNVRLKRIKIDIHGKGNKVIIDDNTFLNNCSIKIYGNNNIIHIGKKCNLNGCVFWLEDNDNRISIDENVTVNGSTSFACIEGSSIVVGQDCMFSSNISLRTGDSHTLTDMEGNRTNFSEDILIGEHVWICANVFINKGVKISSNTVVGSCAVVTKKFNEENIIIAGNPANIIKQNTNWMRERI